ncbi:hypothetical protein RHGRI_003713 [Rhododendron griersonianum]|uniref:S-protein homolog n=1 Tax=Rhododendron griersonianum TaxID=479676 RepID=A0AAV6L8A9_9ERIC|nr:hypothetical protein RHGRI_003713 [Rhododendron griersonianum]
MKYFFLLPLAIVAFHFLCMQTLCHEEQDLIILLPRCTISIYFVGSSGPLNFTCESQYDGTGPRTLYNRQEFHWEFNPYFTKEVPNYLCHFNTRTRKKSFVVYNLQFDRLCTRGDNHICFWLVGDNGFALGNDGVSFLLYKTGCSRPDEGIVSWDGGSCAVQWGVAAVVW